MDKTKKLLRESLPDAIGGTISAVFLGILGLLSGIFGIGAQASLNLAIIGCYLLFLSGTVYIFVARRQGVIDPSQYYPRFSKKLKIFSLLMLILGTAVMALPFLPYQIPDYPIVLVNNTTTDVYILDKPEISLIADIPLGDDIPLVTGRLELLCEKCERTASGEYLIPPESKTFAFLHIPTPIRYKQYFESGEVYMILAILHQNGSWANDGDIIDFNKESFENYYISVELK